MTDICGDNRFEVIAEAKKDLLESTNIEMSPDEMSVIDNILFRCWQMGWLRQYETYEFCASGENPCKEYDQEKHCCHRWTKVIRQTVEELKAAEPERKKGKWIEVHGYATPGGDPVWKCSECGKGIHVYGIEAPSYNRDYTDDHQWVACPNCGADMRGEE